MPVTSSATKALRQDRSRAAHNLVQKNRLKKALKTVTAETHALTVSLIDKAAKNNLIHKNKAGRLKALVSKKVGVATSKRPGAGAKSKTTAKATKKESK
ncbi:30S ribosomal protein S20 [Candidatus Berkelbacteria bacterium]|nr:30S ribosomal protein S20 [Candidatus Berkelbacteria bacterium]